MKYGFFQQVNPHSLRGGVFSISDSLEVNSTRWIDDVRIEFLSERYGISLCSLGLYERKIKLQKMLGKGNYKKLVNKIKILSR